MLYPYVHLPVDSSDFASYVPSHDWGYWRLLERMEFMAECAAHEAVHNWYEAQYMACVVAGPDRPEGPNRQAERALCLGTRFYTRVTPTYCHQAIYNDPTIDYSYLDLPRPIGAG